MKTNYESKYMKLKQKIVATRKEGNCTELLGQSLRLI